MSAKQTPFGIETIADLETARASVLLFVHLSDAVKTDPLRLLANESENNGRDAS